VAYLPEFKNDLFISYRRVIDEGAVGWVSSFQNALHQHLKRLVGDVAIWRDKGQLRTGDQWRDELGEAIESAAIYLAVISRTYLESRECRNELDLMLAMLRADQGKGRRRIFPVYMQPPKVEDDVPAELQGTQHREFFERRADAPLGFSEIEARPDCLEFQQRLTWLAQELTVALERLRDDSLARFAGFVFVADVEPGLYRDRDELSADLFDHRYLVAPEREYLWSSVDIERQIGADLRKSQLSIHLVTPQGLNSEAEVDQARRQLQLAVEAMERNGRPPPLVWVSTREGASVPLQGFLDEIEGPLADRGVEVLVASPKGLEDLKQEVYKRLAPQRPTPPPTAIPAASDDLVVLVDDGDCDAFAAMRVRLIEDFDTEAVPVRLAGSAARDATALAQALAGTPRCLVYWGAQPEDWLQQILRMPSLSAHLGRKCFGILVGAPGSAEKRQFVTRKAHVIRLDDGAECADQELRDFLARDHLSPER
jgi:hypothetical protein